MQCVHVGLGNRLQIISIFLTLSARCIRYKCLIVDIKSTLKGTDMGISHNWLPASFPLVSIQCQLLVVSYRSRKQYFNWQKISWSVFNLTTLRFPVFLYSCRDFYGNYFDKNVTDLKLRLFLENDSPSAPCGKILAGTCHVHD